MLNAKNLIIGSILILVLIPAVQAQVCLTPEGVRQVIDEIKKMEPSKEFQKILEDLPAETQKELAEAYSAEAAKIGRLDSPEWLKTKADAFYLAAEAVRMDGAPLRDMILNKLSELTQLNTLREALEKELAEKTPPKEFLGDKLYTKLTDLNGGKAPKEIEDFPWVYSVDFFSGIKTTDLRATSERRLKYLDNLKSQGLTEDSILIIKTVERDATTKDTSIQVDVMTLGNAREMVDMIGNPRMFGIEHRGLGIKSNQLIAHTRFTLEMKNGMIDRGTIQVSSELPGFGSGFYKRRQEIFNQFASPQHTIAASIKTLNIMIKSTDASKQVLFPTQGVLDGLKALGLLTNAEWRDLGYGVPAAMAANTLPELFSASKQLNDLLATKMKERQFKGSLGEFLIKEINEYVNDPVRAGSTSFKDRDGTYKPLLGNPEAFYKTLYGFDVYVEGKPKEVPKDTLKGIDAPSSSTMDLANEVKTSTAGACS